jgi:transcription-repair coupling factor (superfamily II helicase)
VRELKGEAPREEIDPDVALPVPAFIPDPYMPDVHQRLYFYKRFAQARSDEALEEIRAEIVDRCGEPPDELDALGEVMKVKIRLRALRIRALESGPGRLVLTLGETAALDPFLLARAVQGSGGAWRLTPDMKLVVRLGPVPAPATGPGGGPARPSRVARGPTGRKLAAPPRPAPTPAAPSPAAEAADGRAQLAAAGELLARLAGCARSEA